MFISTPNSFFMQADSSILSQVAVSFIPRLNSNLCLPLLEKCGGIEGFFQETETALNQLYQSFNISPGLFNRHAALENAARELEWIDQHDIRLCSAEDYNYPGLLRQCEDAPLVFFYKGSIQSNPADKWLAIVGTRHASDRCKARVNTVVSDLQAMGCTPIIVSGLAYGIDAAAHRASLQCGLRTFAVLGHGLHMIYPASHKNLAQNILDSGGTLLTEFPCTARTHPSNFLKRNRIIAGLCHATLIAESAEKGGAMSTARIALSYNRDVMAFPGRSDDKYSAGCNRLIKENTAALVDNATDIAQILNYPVKPVQPIQTTLEFFENQDQATIILATLEKWGDTHIDQLKQLTSIPLNELSALLLQMELEGKILALPGKRFASRN